MGVILQALRLDIPETLETPRLRLRATRAVMGSESRRGPAGNLYDSCMYARIF